ncbi:probable G-protein coupled receptor 156 [Mercenaria mercenaria]|uniref:probable G-protein coupled receptor 156 n=1 Tax=Mercenaria mercenaria TaxID=6596 RepID=UPI00234F20F3|nr:probable G-protein coupled receptor 156 [Mercenaria mercenaria]XP_053408564.1 probable G-protein coupled receptor 156 [Mercenaria mercenaria]
MVALSLGTFVVACACATLGLMISLSFLVFHIYHRQNKIVKMSSPYMNMVTSSGAMLLSAVCFLYGLDFILEQRQWTRTVMCQVRVWVIVTSITLILGPLCTKAWRVHSIFKYGFAKKVVIKDSKLLTIIGGLLLVDVTLLSLWQTIDPVSSKTKIFAETVIENENFAVKMFNNTESIQECTCEKLPVWVIVLTLWKITLMISCLIFGWKTKAVTVPCLNDAANTFAAIFVSIIITFCAIMTITSLRRNPDASHIIVTMAIATCIILFQIILFLPKVQYWWKTPDDTSPRISTASLREIASADIPPFHLGDENANTYPDDGLLNIVEENKALKESLLEKEGMITALQSHLDHAKEKLTKLPTDLETKEGIPPDLDASSGIYDILRSPEQLPDRSGLYRVEGTPRSAQSEEINDVTGSQNESDDPRHHNNLKYVESQSFQSIDSRRSFVAEFTDIRNSIETELDSATFINSDLRNSLSADMERPYSETEWLYESNAAPELAGSIVQSYNLGDNQETFSFIQSRLPRENSVFQVKRSRRSSISSAMSMPSSENVSTRSAEVDNVSFEVTPSMSRDSATPNSQQHAAILRYYSYRHLDDGFKRFQTYRVNRDVRPPSFKFKFRRNMPNNSFRTRGSASVNAKVQENAPAIYSVPNIIQKPPRVFKNADWPKDSFV